MSSKVVKAIPVAVQALEAEAFRPFGSVIKGGFPEAAFSRPFSGHPYRMIDIPFLMEGTPFLIIFRFPSSEMVLTGFESHFTENETRIALGIPAVILVAEHLEHQGPGEVIRPDPDSVRAFLIPPSCGVVLHKGTWHGIRTFPVHAPYADFLFIGSRETEAELQRFTEGATLEQTRTFDFDAKGISFEVVDPNGLLKSVPAATQA